MGNLRANVGRFRARFYALACIGATPDGGVHRPAFRPAHLEARRWYLETAKEAGRETNWSGRATIRGRSVAADAPVLFLGSHLDSVPQGRRFDGSLGVAAALEVQETVKEQGLALGTHLEAVDFTDEEGHCGGMDWGQMGSCSSPGS